MSPVIGDRERCLDAGMVGPALLSPFFFLLITVMCNGDAIRMTTSQVSRRFRRMGYHIVTDRCAAQSLYVVVTS